MRPFYLDFFVQLFQQCCVVLAVDCLSFFKVVDKDYSQKTVAMTFPADGTVFAFLGAVSPPAVHCFDCFLVSGVVVDPCFINCYEIPSGYVGKGPNTRLKRQRELVFGPQSAIAAAISHKAFSFLKIHARCSEHVQEIRLRSQLSLEFDLTIVQYYFVDFFDHFWRCCLFWTSTALFVFTGCSPSLERSNPSMNGTN